MGTERVDKGWQQRGIDTYSTEAILGTLAHYGVTLDEAAFKAAAAEDYPFAIAGRWHQTWKGVGQFSHFPAAAAEELWRRWCPGQVAPSDIALAVLHLLEELAGLVDGAKDEGTLETRFKVVEAYLPKIPAEAARHDRFVGELLSAFGQDGMKTFDAMAEALVRAKHDALADRFVTIEETILVQRKDVAKAIVQAERGDEAGAVKALSAIAADATRDFWNRLSAVDALFDFEDFALAKQALLPLFDEAERSKDLERLSAVVEHLADLLERDPRMPERNELRARIEKIAAELAPHHGDA